MPEIKPEIETFAKIKVTGVGGSGGSAINRMIASKIRGVEFIAVNTDVQALQLSQAKQKLHIGQATTRGLGAGMDPDVGLQSAQESVNEIRDALKGADMVFVTCGLGGGTGTGASPIVASVAKEMGALVVAVVTRPFSFEGAQRGKIADRGFRELRSCVDTIITIPNDKILQVIDKKTPILEAFNTVDDVLRQGVQGISEIITIPALINVDFADVKSIMQDKGSALMGIGEASGENRAIAAAKMAISSPLLDISIDGAKGVLFVIYGGNSMTMNEVYEAANVITESADPNAKIIFGAAIDDSMKDKLRITVVATGFDGDYLEEKAAAEEPKYNMNRFFTKKNIDEKAFGEERLTVSARKAASPSVPVDEDAAEEPVNKIFSQPAPVQKPAAPIHIKPRRILDDEEDLEVPAFIRRKMR